MWDGWVDPEHDRTHISGHWNYPSGTVKPVYIVSTGRRVELFLNDKSLGIREPSYRFWFTFDTVAFQPGVLKAVSYDDQGQVLSEDLLKTAGEPAAVRLLPIRRPVPFMADGSDMLLLEVEVVDAQGNRCPTAHDVIDFSVLGPAEFIGGLAKGRADNYLHSTRLPVECGVNRILIRSTRLAGQIHLLARSGDLQPDTLVVVSKPVEVVGGLSTYMQGRTLPSRLDRGPTPSMPSYRVTRVPVSILHAQAGTNQEDAIASYDDNETTEWRNDGRRSTGWIQYELARAVQLNEVCMKLTGWRNRSYALRILSDDGTVLWQGQTPRSLGYVTLPLKSGVMTRSVRLELVGSSRQQDAYSAIVEVEQGKNLDLFDKTNPQTGDAKDELRIVEIEFYTEP
jgi:hypothetical protein